MEPAAGLDSLDPLLIANRGEIAARVIRTARAAGLRTVAVYTEADEGSAHLRLADRAERVSSYLDPDSVLAAAERSGASAIHPGYGFLSENARFARSVTDAGLVWVGPPPDAIELMGDKGKAKLLASESGVPVVPGSAGEEASPEAIEAFAAEHGYPVIVKALAGGGGKGMRVVREAAELEDSMAAARREAEAAFGDGRLLVERYLDRPRHIEVQILCDSHGAAVHLGERECSLQRRHQKVIEEAPSPVASAGLRERMGEAAVALARACGYEGAGTVELIVPATAAGESAEEFFFLEMNTRLQVEHPVTEMVWGVDLVEQQLRVAAGEPLGFGQEELSPSGHAVEARLYAEDPAAGFLPATGTIRRWREPRLEGVRFDSGVAEGSTVGTDFDPMLAKVIAHGPDRATAIRRLDRALAGLELLGVANNAAFSRALLGHEPVKAGEMDTGMLERLLEPGDPGDPGDGLDLTQPADLAPAGAIARYLADTRGASIPPGPWTREFEGAGEMRIEAGAIRTAAGDHAYRVLDPAGSVDGELVLEIDGTARRYAVAAEGDSVWIGRAGHHLELRIARTARSGAAAMAGSLEAPMPGKVLSVEVADGEEVGEGQLLMILESMKMELRITAPAEGTVEGLAFEAGDQVAQGDALLAVVPAGEEHG